MPDAKLEKRNRASSGKKKVLISLAVLFDILPFLVLVGMLALALIAFAQVNSYLSWIPFHSWIVGAVGGIGLAYAAPVLFPTVAAFLTFFQWFLDVLFVLLQGFLFWVLMHAPPWARPNRLFKMLLLTGLEALPGIGFMINVLFPHTFTTWLIIRDIKKEDKEYNEEQERKLLALQAEAEKRQARRGFPQERRRARGIKNTQMQQGRGPAIEYEAANDNYEAANDNKEREPIPKSLPTMDGVRKAA